MYERVDFTDNDKDAMRAIESGIGRKLSKGEQRILHEEITGEGYGYHEIIDIGMQIFE